MLQLLLILVPKKTKEVVRENTSMKLEVSMVTIKCVFKFRSKINPRQAKQALGSEENSRCVLLIDSKMAGPIKLKLGRMVESIKEKVLTKEFFGSVEVDRGQVSGPQVPLLGHGDDKETPNWA